MLLPLTRIHVYSRVHGISCRVNATYSHRSFSGHHGAPDYYDILGVRKTATRVEINMAYKKLAKRYHPDMTGGDHAFTEKFRQVTRAYNVLHNPTTRKEYDTRMQQGPAGYHHTYHRQSPHHEQYSGRSRGANEEETMDEKKARWMREARPMSGFQIFTLWAFIFAVPFFALRSLHRRAHPHDPDYWNGMPSDGNPYSGMGPPTRPPTDPAARKDLVRAFWNPITERWEWLGEVFDPPSASQLLGWINAIQPNYFEAKLREGKAVMPLRASTDIKVGYVPLECTELPPMVRTRPTGHCERWDANKQQIYEAATEGARRTAAYYRQQAFGRPGYPAHPGYHQGYGGPSPGPPFIQRSVVGGDGMAQPYPMETHSPSAPPPPPSPPAVVF
ncbi:chaperone protein dnaj, putative [Perkinsus marinus ATCC 50983]|uniref:Chaperone protein dnaj, putative n=1 Tax=Perkinsus marinus (strain ATCC 50983 / TXsc) TaxID=423536 RepID=C5KLA5_PERM5|nr:chaperone protein dnaj, putative [Perkinsus marinus ATCC 50983]EER14778.1 chaperone protein dnaj, putative [Perkinsus marinus ATCC 50983]|eukprot:XP_002782982.1 chaperone protein dnaj, putative [Perkinsus marinus ATCC 50983]